MKWFEGAIPEAIQAAKVKNSIFIVYIAGEDDLSKQMNATWEDAQVSELCEEEGCVAVKIKANSDECGFFSQIYPVVVVPSTFFIGANGVPLEVTGGYLGGTEFLDKVKSVVQTHLVKCPPTQTTPTQVPKSEPSRSEPAAAAASAAQVTEPAAASTSVSREGDDVAETQAKIPKLDHDSKVDKAKQVIEQKRLEKRKQEEEEVKRKEMERIKLGQEVQKLKQFQQDRELKETAQQLKKDREDDKKARERIKEQIARDRAERAARFNKEKADREKTQEEAKRAKLMAQQQAAAKAEAERSETARIQFRLPDGSSVTQQFPSRNTLQEAYNFVSQHVGGEVTLSTTFPRRTFSDADMSLTFADLQLAPSSVVMVIPGTKSVARPSGGGGGAVSSGGILQMILAPFLFLLNILRSFFSSSSPSTPPPSTSTQRDRAAGGDRRTGAYPRRGAGGGTASGGVSRNEGKVHRFRNADDDDDDRATYNGNSTQQM
ncbi:UBX domain-containing protein 4-like [Haliotis rufescens]|uniref:UBX domain-containing protein 4-like n=1 Tax=Haliotis rufescens TaxID=6454 RepID=UPI00201E7972|nr:UBX domain-containing protein 4-like [Haliotis rufescens]